MVSIFATTVIGFILAGCQQNQQNPNIHGKLKQQYTRNTLTKREHTVSKTPTMVANPERANYKPIPLETIKYSLQGRDPADLALNAFEEVESTKGTRKVEVAYPRPNQALVIVTQTTPEDNYLKKVRYRVEFTTFGRSLLINSPRAWQIVWAGSQKQCMFQKYHRLTPVNCQQTLER
ncbi:MAG: hypothetical protein AAF378_03665 [Cyanobacteria bacterium P01_A01_bin.84]